MFIQAVDFDFQLTAIADRRRGIEYLARIACMDGVWRFNMRREDSGGTDANVRMSRYGYDLYVDVDVDTVKRFCSCVFPFRRPASSDPADVTAFCDEVICKQNQR